MDIKKMEFSPSSPLEELNEAETNARYALKEMTGAQSKLEPSSEEYQNLKGQIMFVKTALQLVITFKLARKLEILLEEVNTKRGGNSDFEGLSSEIKETINEQLQMEKFLKEAKTYLNEEN